MHKFGPPRLRADRPVADNGLSGTEAPSANRALRGARFLEAAIDTAEGGLVVSLGART